MSLNWMKKKEEQCDVLSVTDRSVGNKNRWVIDSECSQHISSNRKMFSSYTSVQGGEVFMILLQVRWLAKEQSSFGLMMHASLLFRAFVTFSDQGTILSLLEQYKRKCSVSVWKMISWKFSKRPMWYFKPNVSSMCICYKIQKLQLVNCNYHQLQKRCL